MCWSDLECDNTNPVGEDRDFFSSCNPTRLHARRPSQFVKPFDGADTLRLSFCLLQRVSLLDSEGILLALWQSVRRRVMPDWGGCALAGPPASFYPMSERYDEEVSRSTAGRAD